MNKASGWLLDCYLKNDSKNVVLWIKKEDGECLRLKDPFSPALFIEPNGNESALNIHSLLELATGVKSLQWVERNTLSQRGRKKVRQLLECQFETPNFFKLASNILQRHPSVKDLYNVDLLPIQLYLYTKLKIEPTSRVEVAYDADERLVKMTKLEGKDEDRGIKPPPFTSLYFDIHPCAVSLTPLPQRDPIQSIEVVSPDGEEKFQTTLSGKENEVLERFFETVREVNPDFLFAPEADNFSLPYLKTRADLLGIDFNLGRESSGYISSRAKKLGLYLCPGRVCLDYSNYGYSFDDSGWGIAGLVERSRFACLPPSIAGRWTANRVNDSRICFELIQRGHVIPKNRGAFEFVRSLGEIHHRDRGGMIISPQIRKVHYNVGELDFDSLFPNLIVKRNISFETVSPDGVDVENDEAILPFVTKDALERRLFFKRLRKSFPKGSQEWSWCEQRQAALKLVLVCIYGTSGCCWNRFGNVIAFEEINRTAREVLIQAKDYAQNRGFEIIKGHTDSLFTKKDDASKEDYEELAKQISQSVGLPMSLDHHYRFLILLPQEGDDSDRMEAMTRYFGLLWNGEVLARGIEIRRHDTPKFIKDFEVKLIQTLFDCSSSDEVTSKGYEEALRMVTNQIDLVMTGELTKEDLMISKVLRKPLSQYNSLFPHVTAALQLASQGKLLKAGDTIDFIFKDSDHVNPLCRTVPYELADQKILYDKSKYRDLLLDATETILGSLGFSRDLFNYNKKESYNWLSQIYEERRKEALSEIEYER
jgi:DNA polymerase elongation subunit (family B)